VLCVNRKIAGIESRAKRMSVPPMASADEDEPGSGDEREHDAEEQHLLLVFSRDAETGHDDEEDEQVVDRERLLGATLGNPPNRRDLS
jgi:hypothetical protein